MKRQEWFNQAVKGLASQGWVRSASPSGRCRYRGPSGTRCAVGWLISDEEAERGDRLNIGAYHLRTIQGEKNTDGNFLMYLQDCHDSTTSPEHMKERLRQFSREYDLAIPPELD